MQSAWRLLLLWCCSSLFAVVGLAGCRGDATDGAVPVVRYQTDAGGAPAQIADRWTIRFDQPVGIVTALARCGETAFLVDVAESAVHRVDLGRGVVVGQIGRPAELDEPISAAADCSADRLYVSTVRVVLAYRISDGALVRTYELPQGVSRIEWPAVTRDHQYLHAAAFWRPAAGFSATYPQDALFKGAKLGLRLSLADGKTEAMVDPIERGCRGYADGCWQSTVTINESGAETHWLVSQGLSPRIAVYNPQTRARRLIAITSPLFKNDGHRLDRGADRDAQDAWSATNSSVYAVLPFGETIATVHRHHDLTRRSDGGLVQFAVFLNLHAMDGTPLVSDIRLPDLPRGRDDDSLYVVDYGKVGRRGSQDTVDIVRIIPTPESYQSRKVGITPGR